MQVRFVYPKHLQHHPLLYRLIRQFDLEANIIEAQVTPDGGYVVADLSGDPAAVEQALTWMSDQGVQVEELEESSR